MDRPPAKPPSARALGITGSILAMIAATVALEGGYVNHPSDPGGETYKGVTKRVASRHGWTGPMRKLPDDVVNGIYYVDYVVAPGYLPLAAIDAPVATEVFDTAVNMGTAKASRFLQMTINQVCGTKLTADGRVGAATIAAYRSCQSRHDPAALCATMLDALDSRQHAEYDRLVQASARYRPFYRGWIAKRIGNVDRRLCKVTA